MSVTDFDSGAPDEAQEVNDLPPSKRLPAGDWVKKNLFNNWYNSLITVVVILCVAYAVVQTLGWLFSSDFLIIRRNLAVFMVGQFPRDELWRPWVSGISVDGGVRNRLWCVVAVGSGRRRGKGFADRRPFLALSVAPILGDHCGVDFFRILRPDRAAVCRFGHHLRGVLHQP